MREIQNRSIAESLRRAIQQKKEKKLEQREKDGFAQLRREFEDVGLMWFGTEIDKSTGRSYTHSLIPVEQKKEHYIRTLTTLKNRPYEQRIQLLRALASGMRLTENNTYPAFDAKYEKRFRFAPLGYSGDNPLRVSFTRPSKFFIEAVGDMSGHSEKQKQEFREFMVKKSGLTGKVRLPQLFPAISQWIDRTK